MKNVGQLIEGLKRNSAYLGWAAEGRSPENIKAHAMEVLADCLSDPEAVERIPLPALAHEAVSVESLRGDPWASDMFDSVLREYRIAALVEQEASFAAIAEAEPAIVRGMSEFMSLFLMENHKDDLDLEEFRLEASRNIGGLVEACLKPQLQALLHQVRIRRGKTASFDEISRVKLGSVVQELRDTLDVPELVVPSPWGLTLSQWRNIAQHHDSWVEGDSIVCRYDEGNAEKTIRLSRSELIAVIERIQRVLGAIRTARAIVVLDDLEQLGGRVQPRELRPEVALFQLATALATQGFEVADFSAGDDVVVLSVLDAAKQTGLRRMIHSSQFVVPVWQAFPRDTVVVKYLDTHGDSALTSTATGADCEAISSGAVPFEELARRITLQLADGRRA